MLRVQVRLSVIALILGAFCAQKANADVLENDFLKMQGLWTLYYAEWQGSSFLPGASVGLEIQNQHYQLVAPNAGAIAQGQFALYQMAWPRQINYVPLTGPFAGQPCLGIYSVIGNLMYVCFAPPGQQRPTDFITFPGSGQILNVWIRQP
jgi:uncharacterized protein (TIGR03067 family)